MNVVKIPITKTSIVNSIIHRATKLAIPFDGIVYASILYAMDHGLKTSYTKELFITDDTRIMYLSDFLVSYIKSQSEKMKIDDVTYIKQCLDQIDWVDNADDVIKQYYNKRLDDGSARKISKTK